MAALAATAARRVAASAKVSEVMAPLVAEPTAGQTGVVAAAAVAEMAAVPHSYARHGATCPPRFWPPRFWLLVLPRSSVYPVD